MTFYFVPIVIIGRKEMFYLTTHSTHIIYDYIASDSVKHHTDRERGNQLLPHGLLFLINSKGSFNRQDSTHHSLCYTSRGALAGMRNSNNLNINKTTIMTPTTMYNGC